MIPSPVDAPSFLGGRKPTPRSVRIVGLKDTFVGVVEKQTRFTCEPTDQTRVGVHLPPNILSRASTIPPAALNMMNSYPCLSHGLTSGISICSSYEIQVDETPLSLSLALARFVSHTFTVFLRFFNTVFMLLRYVSLHVTPPHPIFYPPWYRASKFPKRILLVGSSGYWSSVSSTTSRLLLFKTLAVAYVHYRPLSTTISFRPQSCLDYDMGEYYDSSQNPWKSCVAETCFFSMPKTYLP